MKALGIADEDALQGCFIRRIETFLDAHGRRLIGWDEILQGRPAADGHGDVLARRRRRDRRRQGRARRGAGPAPTALFRQPPERPARPSRRAAARGHPARRLRLRSGAGGAERRGNARHILGLQGNLWTEHIRTEARVEAMAFPRAAAVAEVGWSPQGRAELGPISPRACRPSSPATARLGLKADDAALQVRIDVAVRRGGRPGRGGALDPDRPGQIRYTTDGSAPDRGVVRSTACRSCSICRPTLMRGRRLRGTGRRSRRSPSERLDAAERAPSHQPGARSSAPTSWRSTSRPTAPIDGPRPIFWSTS